MMSILIHQDLWDVVSGELKKPDSNSEKGNEIAEWSKKDQMAKATIILSITPIQILHVKNCTTSNEVWVKLNGLYKPKGPARKVHLFKTLIGMRMSESESAQEYVCKFCAAVDKLAETGVSLQDELFVIMLLASLPKSFDNLVVALESRDELPSLDMTKIKIIEEGDRRNVGSADSNNSECVQAFMARDNMEKKKQFVKKKYNGSTDVSKIKCYNCGRKGHFARQCTERKTHVREQNKQNQKRNELFATIHSNVLHKGTWVIDSGASSHMCCSLNIFDKFEEQEEIITLAGNSKIVAKGKGEVQIRTQFKNIILQDVLYVPDLQCNFISVTKAVKHGYDVNFKQKSAKIEKNGKIILYASMVGDLFLFESKQNTCLLANSTYNEILKWHKRFGHLNFASLRKLISGKMIKGIDINIPLDVKCEVCMRSKCTQKPFKDAESRASEILELVHSDVCDPMRKQSIGGARYILTFIDDKSRYAFIYFIKYKDEVFEKFKERY